MIIGLIKRLWLKGILIIPLLIGIPIPRAQSQSFYQEKEPKINFYRLGLGIGTFFSAPRPSYDSIVNEKMPVLSLGFGRKFNNHLSIKADLSFQPFASNEVISGESGEIEEAPIFEGYNYGFDITPTFGLMPSFHHMNRPIIDFQGGIGIGYLLTYRSEVFTFQDKEFEFKYFESSFYLPIKVSTVIRLGILSDLEVEGAFFYTFLDDSRNDISFSKDSDHFGQMNLKYRKYFR